MKKQTRKQMIAVFCFIFAAVAIVVAMALAVACLKPCSPPYPETSVAHWVDKPAKDFTVDETQQLGKDIGWWDMQDLEAKDSSIVAIYTPSGNLGSGVVLEYGEYTTVMTAYHVAHCRWLNPTYTVVYRGGKVHPAVNPSMWIRLSDDVAVLRFKSRKGLEIEPVKLATKHVKPGDKLLSLGYGGDSHAARKFYSHAAPGTTHEGIFHDCPLLAGDSGGPVFNSDYELVGIHVYGLTNFESAKLKTRVVWPGVSIGLTPLKALKDELDTSLKNGIALNKPHLFEPITPVRIPLEDPNPKQEPLPESSTYEGIQTPEGYYFVPGG